MAFSCTSTCFLRQLLIEWVAEEGKGGGGKGRVGWWEGWRWGWCRRIRGINNHNKNNDQWMMMMMMMMRLTLTRPNIMSTDKLHEIRAARKIPLIIWYLTAAAQIDATKTSSIDIVAWTAAAEGHVTPSTERITEDADHHRREQHPYDCHGKLHPIRSTQPQIISGYCRGLIQDAQLSQRPRCTVRYSFGQKWKTGTGGQYFMEITGLFSTTVIQSTWKSIEFGEKNKGCYGVQGHSRSSRSVRIESPYATSY